MAGSRRKPGKRWNNRAMGRTHGRRSHPSPRLVWLTFVVVVLGACSGGRSGSSAGSTPSTVKNATTTTASGTGASTTAPPPAPAGPQGGPVPANFAAVSVTFVSLQTGWVLGAAPCGTPPCTSLLRTRDGGKTWAGVPAPQAELSVDQSPGVSHVRFADMDNGWAFGPALWATHDGGSHWSAVTLPGADKGARVDDLAAAGGAVHAVVIGAGGIDILSSPVGSDAWRVSPTTVPLGAGPVPHAQLILSGASGWVVEVNRTVVGGARLSAGAWAPWQPPCLDAGGPMILSAASPTDLVAVCDEGIWTGATPMITARVSGDGGTRFSSPSRVPAPWQAGSTQAVASTAPRTQVVAGTTNDGAAVLLATFDTGATWTTVKQAGNGRWTDVGFTSTDQGVAVDIPADARAGALLMTLDGGHTWNAVAFR